MSNSPTIAKKRRHDGVTEADRRNGRRLVGWSLLFAVLYIGATAWLTSDSSPDRVVALAIAVGCTLVGLGALAAYRRFLREADELTRRIQLEGVAFAFGVALLFSILYQLFETGGAPELSLADSGAVMAFAYVAGVLLAGRRYR